MSEKQTHTVDSCEISVPRSLTKDQLFSFRPFKQWWDNMRHNLSLQRDKGHTFSSSPYELKAVDVQAVDFFGGERIGFIKLKATVENADGESLPGAVFLRGGSVAMLLILQPDDVPAGSEEDKHVILAVQPRVPACSLGFVEIPAGMLDDGGTFAGGAAREIEEETGMKVPEEELVDMTKLALGEGGDGENGERLQQAVYPSCGGSDEFIPMFLHERRVPRRQLKEWQGKLTGLRDHGEKITLKVVPLKDLWREGARDAKALSALALYEGLKKAGRL